MTFPRVIYHDYAAIYHDHAEKNEENNCNSLFSGFLDLNGPIYGYIYLKTIIFLELC